jgi:predicted DNA-binding protein (UPF0251 family)
MKEQIPFYPKSRMDEPQHLHLTIREIFALRHIYRKVAQQHSELKDVLNLNGDDLRALESANKKLTDALPKVRKV